ncbi:MAG: filamentous hemagglutinin N-terminal domain-containing protein [Methylococcaceae bacterium]
MKAINKNLPYMLLWLCYSVNAQVITDGTMGVTDFKLHTLSPDKLNTITIPQNLGTTQGHNLFHSFNTFNINKAETVVFTGANDLKNLISRVTGGEVSTINGTLKSTIGSANFYFINPAGIIFGKDASVDIPAAFYLSSGQVLNFKDATSFNSSLATTSQLSVAQPKDFGFLNNSDKAIKLENSQLNFNNDVTFHANTINFNNSSLIVNSGSIHFDANNQLTLNNSQLLSQATDNNQKAGDIEINAEQLIVNGLRQDNRGILADDNADITINARQISIKDEQIKTYAQDAENSGNIYLKNVKNLALNNTLITTSSSDNSTGFAGDIIIDAQLIDLNNRSKITASTYGDGHAGRVIINNDNLLTMNNSFINSNAHNGTGNAGEVIVNAHKLSLFNGSRIDSYTYATGNANQVIIKNNKDLLVDNSAIYTSSDDNSTGHAGNILISSEAINIINGGQIDSSTNGLGHAGNIAIIANTLNIEGQNSNNFSQISAEASKHSSGKTGWVDIVVKDSLNLKANAQISIENNAQVHNGNAVNTGLLNISAQDIYLSNGSAITAQATGDIHAGQINTVFSHSLILDNASINTMATSGNGGNLTITGGHLMRLQNHAHIDTDTFWGQKGGDIVVNAAILALNNAQIKAQANEARNGGNIDLNLGLLLPSQNQLIVDEKLIANSESNQATINSIQAASSGTVNLHAPQLNINGSMVLLNNTTLELPDLNRDSCDNTAINKSSLTRISKGGIAMNEQQWIFTPPIISPSITQLQAALMPSLLTTILVSENYPCATLSL